MDLKCIADWINSNQGIIALAAVFISYWAIIKPIKQQKIDKENFTRSLLRVEYIHNQAVLDENRRIIIAEIEFLEEKKSVIIPLSIFRNGSYQIFSINMPETLMQDEKSFLSLQAMFQKIEYINRLIETRHAYSINNEAMDNYERRLGIYDKQLLDQFMELESIFSEIKKRFVFMSSN